MYLNFQTTRTIQPESSQHIITFTRLSLQINEFKKIVIGIIQNESDMKICLNGDGLLCLMHVH